VVLIIYTYVKGIHALKYFIIEEMVSSFLYIFTNESVVRGSLQLFGKKRNGAKLVERGVHRWQRLAWGKTVHQPHIPKRPKGEKELKF